MTVTLKTAMAGVDIDIGKNSFHVVGLDQRGDRAAAESDRDAKWTSDLPHAAGESRFADNINGLLQQNRPEANSCTAKESPENLRLSALDFVPPSLGSLAK